MFILKSLLLVICFFFIHRKWCNYFSTKMNYLKNAFANDSNMFSLCSWNILAPDYEDIRVSEEDFLQSDRWETMKYILSIHKSSHVFCFQEVQRGRIAETLTAFMNDLNFVGVLQDTSKNKGAIIQNATFFRSDLYDLETPAKHRYRSVIIKIVRKDNPNQRFMIGNVHLQARSKLGMGDVQIQRFNQLESTIKSVNEDEEAIGIVCGDFNDDLPENDHDESEQKEIDTTKGLRKLLLGNGFGPSSLLTEDEITFVAKDYKKRVDHIWSRIPKNPNHYPCFSISRTLFYSRAMCEDLEIPDKNHPSDHLMIGVQWKL